jgi:hypothetical protein
VREVFGERKGGCGLDEGNDTSGQESAFLVVVAMNLSTFCVLLPTELCLPRPKLPKICSKDTVNGHSPIIAPRLSIE